MPTRLRRKGTNNDVGGVTTVHPKQLFVYLVGICCYLLGILTCNFARGWTAIREQTSNEACGPGNQGVRLSPKGTNDFLHVSNEATMQPPVKVVKKLRNSNSGRLRPDELKMPTPIIVMGLMKAGTTSIYGYFKCGLHPQFHSMLSHYYCGVSQSSASVIICGKRMRRNIQKMKKPTFDQMDQFILHAELDAQELNGGMTLPQWTFIQEIYEAYPNATWILNVREASKWLDSVNRWKDLRQRFIDNPYNPELPKGKGGDDQDMLYFYSRQAERVREFASTHPSLKLVEVPIDDPDAGDIMENAFGISAQCWGNRNVNNGTAIWTEN